MFKQFIQTKQHQLCNVHCHLFWSGLACDRQNKEHSQIRLVLTTSILGMEFNPENVRSFVYSCLPRNISLYFQEQGGGGCRGKLSVASLYYSARNISRILHGICEGIIQYCENDTSCLRNYILSISIFGFQKNPGIGGCKCCCICKKSCVSLVSTLLLNHHHFHQHLYQVLL